MSFRLWSHAGLIGLSYFVSAGTALLAQIVLARSVSTVEFGGLVLAQAVLAVVEGTVVVRSGEIALYWLGRTFEAAPQKARSYARYLWRREFLWNSVTYVSVLGLTWPLNRFLNVDVFDLAVLALTIPAQSGYGVAKSTFLIVERQADQALVEILASLVQLILVVVLTTTYQVIGFVSAVVLGAAIKTVASTLRSNALWPPAAGHLVRQAPPSNALSFHSILRNLLNTVASQVDVVVLGVFASREAAGLYKVAKSLATLPTRATLPIWAVLRPRVLSAVNSGDDHALRLVLGLPAIWFTAIGMILAPAVAITGGKAIDFLYGDAFAEATPPFYVLLIGSWVYGAVTGWLSFLAVLTDRKAAVNALFGMLALSACLGALLARSSLLGMAFASAGSLVLTSAVAWGILWRGHIYTGKGS